VDRAFWALRGAYGLLLTLGPRPLLGSLAGGRADRRACAFARVLGARQLLEALALRRPAPRLVALGAGVDAMHALTALAIAARRPARRRLACLNAAVAGAFALQGAVRRT
jgi:hypothetical protein